MDGPEGTCSDRRARAQSLPPSRAGFATQKIMIQIHIHLCTLVRRLVAYPGPVSTVVVVAVCYLQRMVEARAIHQDPAISVAKVPHAGLSMRWKGNRQRRRRDEVRPWTRCRPWRNYGYLPPCRHYPVRSEGIIGITPIATTTIAAATTTTVAAVAAATTASNAVASAATTGHRSACV